MRKIVVTGGAGFIGCHLCRSLARSGLSDEVIIVDSLHPYYDPALKRKRLDELTKLPGISYYPGDILDAEQMDKLFQTERPEAVIHLAAIPGVRRSLAEPLLYIDADVKGTVQLLELCRRYSVPRFLFASSSSVYGEKKADRPFREEEAGLAVVSPYAASKLAAEVFLRTYADLYGLNVTVLRFFTVYGPEQRPDMAISRFVSQLTKGEPLTLYDPGSLRDYTYVEDIVRGIEAALIHSAGWQVYNLGSGRPTSLVELVRLLEQVSGQKTSTVVLGKQPGDVSGTWADISAARHRLNWAPVVSLEEGLARFWKWWQTK
ncbi:MAG: NAD-dependent epimerase/dehydratase family protein [Brevibacillus sp.]|nr:NAD-dependent epimerase/dehydratase family protein [Brevibacillus sp.]